MRKLSIRTFAFALLPCTAASAALADEPVSVSSSQGQAVISTIPFDPGKHFMTGTYTPSGKVLAVYNAKGDGDRRNVTLATMNDDGTDLRPFFSQRIPDRPKDNGIRYMVFPDNRRIFLGDFVVECAGVLEKCGKSKLVPVVYPKEVADGDYILFRWSEMVIAPDNRHVAWTTLFSNYGAAAFSGELRRDGDVYRIVQPRIISTIEPFSKDPKHEDGVIPQPLRGGEVKQFIHGGSALSLVGAMKRDLPDSVTLDMATGVTRAVTDTPGYTETTIFSPDEKLGLTMTSRFSDRTDPAVLGLLPRPYPASLNMGLSMLAYTYAVTGVREGRDGNVGPALIDIAASANQDDYKGTSLAAQDGWVFNSPMSWHPSSQKGMWVESLRGQSVRRMRMVRLPDYRPGRKVAARQTPIPDAFASSNMALVPDLARKARATNVKVYGRVSGHIVYNRTDKTVTKTYVNFSDDGTSTFSGQETLASNPRGRSTYEADVKLAGPIPGEMKLKITFGPIFGDSPAGIIFDRDGQGAPLSHGFASYGSQRLEVDNLLP